jgi:hypothetical protein
MNGFSLAEGFVLFVCGVVWGISLATMYLARGRR